MRTIDSHQHFWKYDPIEYPWIKPEWPIQRSFGPDDLKPLLQQQGFDGCIAVQARQSLQETEWLLQLAEQHPIISGVVGWVDLRSPALPVQLARFASNPKLVGVRHVVQDEPDDRFMLREDFLKGIEQLEPFNLAYDILIFPRQLPAAIELARHFPKQRFVLDHIAKPSIKDQEMEPWRTLIQKLAQAPNVECKLSGMVTEAQWQAWTPKDFEPFLNVIWDAFGPDRLMIGSDWPVSLLSANYDSTMSLVIRFLERFSKAEREKILGANAVRFYRLPA